MDLQSTIYIRDDLLDKLMNAVDRLEVNRSELIEALLIKYMESNEGGKMIWKMLKYQKLVKGTKARRISVCWYRDVYERSIDCKKIYRKSVSLIIADAIEMYLDEIINELNKNKDAYNYRASSINYQKYSPEARINVTIWGVPESEILDKLRNL